MKRIHLFEFEDQSWFPNVLRDCTTDFLQHEANKSKGDLYDKIIPVINKGVASAKCARIVDLASGGGGPWPVLNGVIRKSNADLKVTLTDYFPNLEAFTYLASLADNIDFITTPVDARNVPVQLEGLRTQFLSFHHFKPDDARRILQNAVDTKNPIAVFEDQERSARSILLELMAPLWLLLRTVLIRPFKLQRIIFTYILPVLPFTLLWDGVVSCLRTYSLDELDELIDKVENKNSFEWETGRIMQGARPMLYLLGTPKPGSGVHPD